MKQCTRCGNTLTDDATYCNVCNTPQTAGFESFEVPQKQNDTFLKILCILTIVGASFGLISGLISIVNDSALPIEGMELVGYISLAIAVAKLGSAIAMLKKKLTGLYVYSVAAILAIAVQIYTVFLTSDYMESMMQQAGAGGVGSAIMTVTIAIMVLFYVTFLILYWLPVNKRHLS